MTMALPWRMLQLCHRPLLPISCSPTVSRAGRPALYYARHRLFTSTKNIILFRKWTLAQSSTTAVVFGCSLAAAAAAAAAVVVTVSAAVVSTDLEKHGTANKENEVAKVSYQMPVDFMDKLASKPYLHFGDYNWHRHRNRRDDANDNDDGGESSKRPVGVPHNLRLLAVDLPEVRYGFSGGECRVAADHVFPDGIAPPILLQLPLQPQDDETNNDKSGSNSVGKMKTPTKRNKNKNKKRHGADLDANATVSVEQKAWVKSMFRCVHHGSSGSSPKVGVRVMEAQTAALNPRNLRKTPHPLLVGQTNSQELKQEPSSAVAAAAAKEHVGANGDSRRHESKEQSASSVDKTSAQHIIKSRFTWRSNPREEEQSDRDDDKKTTDASNTTNAQHHPQQQDMLLMADAPWNQQAWKEELELRISGQVAFGDAMQEASGWWNRLVLGRIYQPTIPLYSSSSGGRRSSVSDWMFFWRRSSPHTMATATTTTNGHPYIGRDESGSGRQDDGGNEEDYVDAGEWSKSDWSFHHKPHAVIANGSALQRVPHSLRRLQKACREHNVPLYVIHDPRQWAGASGSSRKSSRKTRYDDDDHDDDELGAVLQDLRRTLKKRIVTSSLQQQQLTGSRTAFQRGRQWGQLETNMYWQSREAMRKSREAVEHLVQNAKALAATQKKKDWSHADKATLEEKLVRHGVVRKENVKVVISNDDDNKDENATDKRRKTKTVQRRFYSDAFSALAQQWATDQHAEKPVVVDDGMPENKNQEKHSSGKENAVPAIDKSIL